MRTILSMLVLVLASMPMARSARAESTGPTTAEELFEALAALPGLSADYREEKFLTVLVDPVVSKGHILLVPPSKLVRVTTAPIWSSLVATDRALEYRDAAGPQKLPAAKGDPARVFVEIFIDVARGNLVSLRKTFTVSFKSSDDGKAGWTLELTPKKKDFGIRRIEMSGTKNVIAAMKIVEANGDRTELTFSRIKSAKRPSEKQVEAALRPPKR